MPVYYCDTCPPTHTWIERLHQWVGLFGFGSLLVAALGWAGMYRLYKENRTRDGYRLVVASAVVIWLLGMTYMVSQ